MAIYYRYERILNRVVFHCSPARLRSAAPRRRPGAGAREIPLKSI